MAIDYTPLQQDDVKFKDLVDRQQITFEDLHAEVNRLYDAVRTLLENTTDADITFSPHDPDAEDPFAEAEEERHIGWTLGHLVAHMTATNEEGAVFTSLLARGIPQAGRIRTETPWEQIDTVQKALSRLEESRRLVLTYLSAIPDEPDLTTERAFGGERAAAYFGPVNAPTSMVISLSHHNEHLSQFEEVQRQAKAATERA